MDELISRKAVLALAKDICVPTKDGEYRHRSIDPIDVMELSSAEPERPKGEWVDGLPYINSHWWVCSICHVPAPENHTGYNFCPNCGADMRGE